jgi:hypothetical protein
MGKKLEAYGKRGLKIYLRNNLWKPYIEFVHCTACGQK